MEQNALVTESSTVSVCAGRWETRMELPIETEILIPDYLPAVFKIVKCLLEPVVIQNTVSGQRWQGEGYLRCTVYYQSEETGTKLYRTEQKYAFDKSADLPKDSGFQGAATIWGETEYCNCRAISEHRIDVRGAYTLWVAVGLNGQMDLLTKLSGCGIQQRTQTLAGITCTACEEKTFAAETTFPLPGTGETILDIGGNVSVTSLTVRTGQVDVSAALAIQLCSRAADAQTLTTQSRDLPVTQTLDLPDAAEGDEATAWGEILACTLTAPSGEEKEPMLHLTWKLHVELWRNVQYMAVTDAYSTMCETTVERQTCRLLQNLSVIDTSVTAEAEDSLPDPEAAVVGCFVTLDAPQIQPVEAGDLRIGGRGVAHLICTDAGGELTCYDKAFSWTLPESFAGNAADLVPHLHASLTRVTSSKNGTRARVEIGIAVTGRVLCIRSQEAAVAVELGEEFADLRDGPTLYLYYAQQGEAVFEIAKRYHARTADLAAANRLEASPGEHVEDLTVDAACLLIPAAL